MLPDRWPYSGRVFKSISILQLYSHSFDSKFLRKESYQKQIGGFDYVSISRIIHEIILLIIIYLMPLHINEKNKIKEGVNIIYITI